MFDQSSKGAHSPDQIVPDTPDRPSHGGLAQGGPTPLSSTSSAQSDKPNVTKERAPRQYRDTQVDVKLVLSALWIAMMLAFAYVDIFGFYRADVLRAALNGRLRQRHSQ